MRYSVVVSAAVALIVGIAVGYMFNPSVEEPSSGSVPVRHGVIRDDGETASVKALRSRIAELEARLAAGAEARTDGGKPSSEGGAREGRNGRGRGGMSPREWRERMKKEDPARFVQMTNRFAAMRRDRAERAQKKADFLASLDVSGMSASARKVHGELQEMIAKREELEQRLHASQESEGDVSGEDMGKLFHEMHEVNDRIRELNAQERDNLMVETAKSLGFGDAEADEVAGLFQEIVENTDAGWGGPGRHGGHPAPPPRPRE